MINQQSQQCSMPETRASSIETPKEKTNLDTSPPTSPPPQLFEWLARLPLIDDDNRTGGGVKTAPMTRQPLRGDSALPV